MFPWDRKRSPVNQPVRPIRMHQVARRDWGNPKFLQERLIKIHCSLYNNVFILDQIQDNLGNKKETQIKYIAGGISSLAGQDR